MAGITSRLAGRGGAVLAPALLLGVLTACRPAPPAVANPTAVAGTVVPKDSIAQFFVALQPALESHGFVCQVDETKNLQCKHDSLYNITFSYKSDASRLVFWATFGLKDKGACAAPLHEKMNAANWGYNVWKASCKDDLICFEGVLLVPKAGFNHDELFAYLRWWSGMITEYAKITGLIDDIN